MKKLNVKLVIMAVLTMLCGSSVSAESFTALWDFANVNPSSLATVAYEGNEGHIASTKSGVNIYAIAKWGKFKQRTSDAQMNANTYLRIPVYNVGDKVTIVTCTGYHSYTMDGVAANSDNYTYTATSSAVANGWVQMQSTAGIYVKSITLVSSNGTTTTTTTTTTAFDALWDFANVNPSTLASVAYEGNEGHIASTKSGVNIYAIAKWGKFKQRTSDAQMNANTYLRIPVYNVGDKVTIVTCTGYHSYTMDGVAANSDNYTYTATASAVANGWVQMQSTAGIYIKSIKLSSSTTSTSSSSSTSSSAATTVATATWDFKNVNPSGLSGLTIEGKSGHIPSTLSNVSIYCIGNYGKFAQRTSDAQVNQKTTLRIPVTSTSDVVTVTSFPGYHNFSLGGVAATADVTTHTATSAEVSVGYVVLYSTGSTYLYSITSKLNKYVASTSSSSSSSSSSTSTSSSSNTSSNSGTVVSGTIGNYYIVKAGSASDLLNAISKANAKNTSTSASRYCIYLPNGTYNLGTTCLTAITGHNISLIGEDMSKTIIKNAPSISIEGIGTTATILNKGQNNYFQDLTLQNALDYYGALSSGMAGGRAVALQDKGQNTICKNVRLLSYQDTYYTNSTGKMYWEGGDIHGTVDFICGGGDVFFNGTQITVEKRNANGTGGCTIAAPYTDAANKGYIFSGCKIVNYAQNYNYARAWGGKPRCVWLNTVLNDSKLVSSRWTTAGMNTYADAFYEYNTKNTSGTVVSPSSLRLTFTHSTGSKTMETIISSSAAANYSISNVFGSWKPNDLAAQVSLSSLSANGMTLSWKATSASGYAIYNGSSLVAIVGSNTTTYTATSTGTWTVRALNSMGGQGTAKSVSVTGSSSSSSSTSGMSQYDANAPIGWATVGGTVTGSNNKNAVTVTTESELVNALKGTTAATIYVKGTITVKAQMAINGAENKTILGVNGAVLANTTMTNDVSATGVLRLVNCKNIIIRNITFKGPGAYNIDGRDLLTVSNTQYLWVDHCDFQDGIDGNFDCNSASDNVAVTWCRFRYLKAPNTANGDHRFSDLWGSSDSSTGDDGHLRTTFANCWWDEGCNQRMPRVRYGKVHLVNCLYTSNDIFYCVGAGYKSNIYVDKCSFYSASAQKSPWKVMATNSGYTDYNLTVKDCYGASNTQQRSGSNAYFVPSSVYSCSSYSANSVYGEVSKYAGATLSISAVSNAKEVTSFDSFMEEATGVNDAAEQAEVVKVEIYSASGMQVSALQKGLNIVKSYTSDGKVSQKTILVR